MGTHTFFTFCKQKEYLNKSLKFNLIINIEKNTSNCYFLSFVISRRWILLFTVQMIVHNKKLIDKILITFYGNKKWIAKNGLDDTKEHIKQDTVFFAKYFFLQWRVNSQSKIGPSAMIKKHIL
jgi:hypothetical protein